MGKHVSRRWLTAFLLVVCLSFSSVLSVHAEGVRFKDVDMSHPYYQSIAYLQDNGFINGYDGFFNPNGCINLLELGYILNNVYGVNINHSFDVQSSMAERTVTVNTAAAILLDIAEIRDVDLRYYSQAFRYDVDGYRACGTLVAYGYTNISHPTKFITRAEFCDMVAWLLQDNISLPDQDFDSYAMLINPDFLLDKDNETSYVSNHVFSALHYLPIEIIMDFYQDGYTVIYDPDDERLINNGWAGYFRRSNKEGKIVLGGVASNRTIVHEFSHYFYYHAKNHEDVVLSITHFYNKNVAIASDGTRSTTNHELLKICDLMTTDYCLTNPAELFAEAAVCYFIFPEFFINKAPELSGIIADALYETYGSTYQERRWS